MKRAYGQAALMALAAVGMTISVPADAKKKHHSTKVAKKNDHGNCLRFNKTTGTAAGAVAGGVLGNVVLGGTGGTIAGAAAGGLAGHELSTNRRKRC
ncbi:glycine zipper 2TM domain-containing protein [Sphingobium sufflavum]|uniref:glycine zipper 2TM domain-containing protein n=1 Tax=Sphingobium sufflavum TaxID=1129547 RepID=UPI001F2A7C79|nr:glycine zipper 2TM domain-containing protein [Sphingobium sufflavum]MCE7795910.1 glycine zipper 2TM domain-containing protein [Sphingobium sufflavum]